MNYRRSYGHNDQNNRKPLTPERKALQREKASCYMVIKFQDGGYFSKWSNEHAQAWIINIGEAVNEMFRIFEKDFRRTTFSAAIFDTRENKKPGAHNKIYQYEKGVWTMVQPFTW